MFQNGCAVFVVQVAFLSPLFMLYVDFGKQELSAKNETHMRFSSAQSSQFQFSVFIPKVGVGTWNLDRAAEGTRNFLKIMEDSRNHSSMFCRICHEECDTQDSPCHCTGSLLVHLACLEKWLSINKSGICELCGFQFTVRLRNRTYVEVCKLCSNCPLWLCRSNYNFIFSGLHILARTKSKGDTSFAILPALSC